MEIRVGITAGDLKSLKHGDVTLSCQRSMRVVSPTSGRVHWTVPTGSIVRVSADGDNLFLRSGAASNSVGKRVVIKPSGPFTFAGVRGGAIAAKAATTYEGALELTAVAGSVTVVLICDLESYVRGVLQTEVPAYYKIEAMKAQAVLARTYGLRPRLSHHSDGFHVCDSYLHCQAFDGFKSLNALQKSAIAATGGQILSFEGKPALALFSAASGGHTESYENCFSDPVTNAFPPPVIPYLIGVAEGKLPQGYPSEPAMRALYKEPHPQTVDAWSPGHFRWQVRLKADAIEAHMHHVLDTMRKDPQFEPFIREPASGKFGHIDKFEIRKRGVAGTAIQMDIVTSTGTWSVQKELAIRSAFENPESKLKRLRSARIFFDYERDRLGLLSQVIISGFGFGHGVGLQQVGAQGLAVQGKHYRQILAHYYPAAEVSQI